MSVVDKIHHYQRNIEKCGDNEERMLHCISKLYNLPVTVKHLQETGVGRTVNALRKYDGTVGNAAKALVAKWKIMVTEYESNEDEVCVPDVPVSYTDNHESPKLEEVEVEENVLSNPSQESKHTSRDRGNKNEMSTEHSIKHSSKSSTEDKHKKHEKSRHSSKHYSQSELKFKELKGDKNSFRKDEGHSLGEHSKSSNLERENDKISKDNNRKRTHDSTSSLKKESKKNKMSDSKNSDEISSQLSSLEKNHSSSRSSEIKIKIENDGDKHVKQEKNLQEESRSDSSKTKSQDSSSKSKDSVEKQKHKKEEHANHRKVDMKKDSSRHSSKEISESKVSSSKDHVKNKDKEKKTEHKDDKSKHKKKDTKTRLVQEITSNDGIDCNSGTSFAEALGMCTIPQPSRKRNYNLSSQGSSKLIKTEQPMSSRNKDKIPMVKVEPEYNDDPNQPSLLVPNVKLEPLNVDLASTLPEISPNYKPLPHINPVHRKEELVLKPASDIIYVKNQRTKVYSGNKVGCTSVPTLYEMCMRVLIENIDALEFTGGVPYDIIKPVLERATSDQLFILENYNPYLIGDTDELWEFHCNREFRNKQRQEMETWRDMYMRCLDEREAKLKTLTANIKQSIDKSVPVRSTKLAYVDNVVKPPRNILKKQAKYGTANATPATVSSVKKKLTAGNTANNATNITVPPPPMSRFKTSTSGMKKTKAPLMAKALQLIKGRYKR